MMPAWRVEDAAVGEDDFEAEQPAFTLYRAALGQAAEGVPMTVRVTPSAPAQVTVKPGQGRDTTFEISLTIDGSKLPGNFMNSGSNGADPSTLTAG